MHPEPIDPSEAADRVAFEFSLNRRTFVQVLGAGLVVVVQPASTHAQAQRNEGRGNPPAPVSARLHLGEDGLVTLLTGKVEIGQGARAQLAQAAAEELRLPVDRIRLVMADTRTVPDDGVTAGSRTTPSTVPAVRQAAAAALRFLTQVAAQRWGVEAGSVQVEPGALAHPPTGRRLTFAELARDTEAREGLRKPPGDVAVVSVDSWKVLGTSVPRPNARDLVTGTHRFPSDLTLPGMWHGKVLRPPAFGSRLADLDLGPARAMKGVIVVRDGEFAGVAAPTQFRAEEALRALAKTARWEPAPHPSSEQLFDHLLAQARDPVPASPFARELAEARHTLRAAYRIAYVQHAPMETRSALAEWQNGELTVWTGTQAPFRYVSELSRAFRIPADRVRVIVPDAGGGFGGKHTAEAAIEAARLAQSAGRPVLLTWTREEEFTWAYFRPAGLIEAEATLTAEGRLSSWFFINVNSGGSALETPYRIPAASSRFIASQAPLRQGSYRALASTANTFAREGLMDELASLAQSDPLEFRLAHLDNPRLRAVLQAAADRFHWRDRFRERRPGLGVGLACGTEKGSYTAACVELHADAAARRIEVRRVCQVFECGAIQNPENLRAQVVGAIVMGLGPALREAIEFDQGTLLNATFRRYLVPRFRDLPELDIHLLDRPDLPSVGGGETPIIAIAPAIANAVFHATGRRIRQMPVRFEAAEPG